MLLPFDPDWTTAEEIPSDWSPGVLGPRGTVVAAISEVFPGATEDAVGVFTLPDDGTEILVGTEDPTDGVNVSLYGGVSPSTMERLVQFATILGTRALDTQTAEFLTAVGGANSYSTWLDWKNRVLASE